VQERGARGGHLPGDRARRGRRRRRGAAAGRDRPRRARRRPGPRRAHPRRAAGMDRPREQAPVTPAAPPTPAPRVVVLDRGAGNVRSVVRALEAAGAEVELTADRERALAADGLVVPGVGAYASTIAQIRAVGGDRIIERRLAGGRPVL